MPSRLRLAAFLFWTGGSLFIGLSVLRFLAADPATGPGILINRDGQPIAFYLHVFLAGLALALGPFQFVERLRQWSRRLHRISGRVYLVSVCVSALAGFRVAFTTEEGPVAASGFAVLAVVWLGVTLHACRLAVQGRIAKHRQWMVRSFALTSSAMTLRLFLLAGPPLGVPFDIAYPAAAWLSWTINLAVAELILRSAPTTRRPRLEAA